MLLNEIFSGAPKIKIEQLAVDSRMPMKNALFFCMSGIKYDGHKYVKQAIDNGAVAVVYSSEIDKSANAVYIKVNNVNVALSKAGNVFYNYPQENIEKYIITGNYGKSSVACLINNYLKTKTKCGYIGIFGIKYDKYKLYTPFATLSGLDNLKTLDNMRNNGVKACTFEATASALNLKKLDVINPEVLIYTCSNPGSREYSNEYYSIIRKYLYTLEDSTNIILNIDDNSFEELQNSINKYSTYGLSTKADYYATEIVLSDKGLKFFLNHNNNKILVQSRLLGLVNVYNILACIAGLNQQGYDLSEIISSFSDCKYIPGIMERIDDKYNVIVDDAYDINSVETICDYARHICKGKCICVCGINYSDDNYRIEKLMNVLEKYLDVIILTEDETLEGETMKILQRCNRYTQTKKCIHIAYRSIAIRNAISILNYDDCLLILGKGSEKYLYMSLGKEYYHGDKYYAIKYLEERKKEDSDYLLEE